VPVRKYLSGAIAIAWLAATPAFAADQSLPWPSPAVESETPFPTYLPSTQTFARASAVSWSGFYVGGQFSFNQASADFSKSTQAPIAYSLRELTLENEFTPSNWPVLGTADHGETGFGGFVGYNMEYFNDSMKVVLGVEANYNQAALSLTAPNSPISRITPTDSQGNNYLVNITGSGTVTNLNFGTLRARAGWELGNFLPYGFVGVAVGRANVNVTETTSGEQNPPTSGACSSSSTPPCTPFSFTGTAGRDSDWLYGLTVGAGLDVALTRNVFLRAEYEYVQFQPVASTVIKINTGRAGVGIKF
jgi:outer membrane immunogenic protein